MNSRSALIYRICRNVLLPALALATAPQAFAAEGETATVQGDFARDLNEIEEKLLGLAKAIPAEKYSWAPTPEVRTVSQSLMHAATANFFFPSMLGVAPPEDIDLRGLEKITDKSEVLDILERSFDQLRKGLDVADDLAAPKTYFGQDGTVGGLLHSALAHNHEHLGQMIVYARANGVKPPWS